MKLEVRPESVAHHLQRSGITGRGILGIDGCERRGDRRIVGFECEVVADRS
jgi:hypothetical protein